MQKEGENFLDQQFWLYFYGMFVASGVHVITFTGSWLMMSLAHPSVLIISLKDHEIYGKPLAKIKEKKPCLPCLKNLQSNSVTRFLGTSYPIRHYT